MENQATLTAQQIEDRIKNEIAQNEMKIMSAVFEKMSIDGVHAGAETSTATFNQIVGNN